MKKAFRHFRSMSTNEQLGVLVVGIMCYCFGLIPLAVMAPFIARLGA
jgi:hypothetical protein